MTDPATAIRTWREHPARFVRDAFGATPDPWQDDILEAFPRHRRIALKACTGPGKTAVLAWIILNYLVTRPYPKIAATSITGDNLRDNLWAELSRWIDASPFCKSVLEWAPDRICHVGHKDRWWASARTWDRKSNPEQQGLTLAGLHADYILAIVDESGGIPSAVMAAAEGVLANVGADGGAREAHIVQAGNPTHLDGPLYAAFTTEAALWWTKEITGDPEDPNRAPRVSKAWAQERIDALGRDHPWVMSKVLGRFPKQATNSLIGLSDLEDAFNREPGPDRTPKIAGVDVAREGEAETVVTIREGSHVREQIAWGHAKLTESAGRIRELHALERFAEIRVDDIGVGGGLTDILAGWRLPVIGINVGASATDPRFTNLRAEANIGMREEWFGKGAISIAPHLRKTTLLAEGTSLRMEYAGTGEKLKVESKRDYQERTGKSPDRWDSLVLAFLKIHSPAAAALAHLRRKREALTNA